MLLGPQLPTLLYQVLLYGLLVYAQSASQLGYIPLAVKTPYLHGWLANNPGTSPARTWPNFYDTRREFGWAGYIRVDNRPYQWLGNNPGSSNFTRTIMTEITPTKSIFRLEAGPVQFNVTFLSPIEPTDYVRQSIPFTYMYIDGISTNDSLPHNVQVYSDISGQWVSKSDATVIVWDTTTRNNMIYHRVARQGPQPFTDNEGIAEDSTGYYAMAARPNLSWQTGADVDCRGRFTSNGSLANSTDTNFRTVSQSWPVFAISVDLGTINPNEQPQPIVWALGIVRDPLVTYATEPSVQSRSAYYWSAYNSIEQVISAFLDDFSRARSRSQALDNRILSDASTISSNYAAILSLVTRQLFASMDITIPTAQPGQFNNSDVKIFMKDVGSSLRINPVEYIYAALPALLYFNPTMARHLLQPLLEFQSSSRYTNNFAAPDLGSTYPAILGDSPNNRSLAVEHTGNMLIMAYTHAVKSGDGSLLKRYFPLFQSWGDFLIGNALHPNGSSTADGLSFSDMSNLALKGILGVYAIGKISEAVRAPENVTAFYTDSGRSLIAQWRDLAVTQGHITSTYGQGSTWGLMYNVFPAVWLQTGLIGDDLLNSQAQFYHSQPSMTFGFGLDSFQPQTAFPHWMLLTAATVPDSLSSVRNDLINMVYNRAYLANAKLTLPAQYSTSDGTAVAGSGTPAHGAAYAILALRLQNQNITADTVQNGLSNSGPNVGAIVGGVVGGLAFLLLLAGISFFFCRRRKVRRKILIDVDYPKSTPFIYSTDALAVNPSTHIVNPISDISPVVPAVSPVVTNPGMTASASAKHREALGVLNTQTPTHQPAGSASVVLTPSNHHSPSVAGSETLGALVTQNSTHHPTASVSAVSTFSNPYSPSAAGTDDLRAEVEQLRIELSSIRAMADPPPGYV